MNHSDQSHEKSCDERACEGTGTEHSREDFDSKLSEQHPSSKGGITTDMFCPSCGDEICGFYLPVFRCPHCSSMIWRNEDGKVTNYENVYACPECGHGSAMENAKESLINGILSCVHAVLLHGLKMKHVRPSTYSADATATR